MKRILIASLHHESDSFNPIMTSYEDFNIYYGSDIDTNVDRSSSLAGMMDVLRDQHYELIPTVSARAVPNGEIDPNLYEELKKEILHQARAVAETIDGIALALHGSMRVKGLGEAEGDLLAALREIFPMIPIVSSLDMHATMTKRMHTHCDAYVGYKCAPHTDTYETGQHAARILIDILEHGAIPQAAWVYIPFIVAGEQSETNTEPMLTLIKALHECEAQSGIMAASFLMGYPWSDNPDSGVAAYVITDGNQELANAEAIRLADLLWSKRHAFKFHTETYHAERALDVAFDYVDRGETPLYLSDSGDNPTGGSSGDCTNFLKLLLDDPRCKKLPHHVLYGGIYDPAAVACCKHHIGEVIELTFGAAFDRVTSQPLTVKGEVLAYIENYGSYNSALVLFRMVGVDLVLTEKHIGYLAPDLFEGLGVNPRDVEIVVCKLGYLTAPQREVAKKSIMVLTDGSTNEDLSTLTYRYVKRPLFPLDKEFAYQAQDYLQSTSKESGK